MTIFVQLLLALALIALGDEQVRAAQGESQIISNAADTLQPPFTVPWDLGMTGNSVSRDFKVDEYRYYDFQIALQVRGPSDDKKVKALFEFAGDGKGSWVTKESADSENPVTAPVETELQAQQLQQAIREGKYVARMQKSGVMIPVHVVLETLQSDPAHQVSYDRTIKTWNIEGGSPDGLLRHIDSIKLRPGVYRITAATVQAIPTPTAIQASLRVAFRPETKTLNPSE
jgi:hypothetical protein